MSNATYVSKTPSDRLLKILSNYERVLVVMHDNPDPDAIATGWAVLCLIEERLDIPVRLVAGGAIVRAENKYMVDLLSPPIELVTTLEVDDCTATILVDCGIGTTNHLVTQHGIHPVAVIDHHLDPNTDGDLAFSDIRTDAAASACIAASYLQESNVEPGIKLATAILYAIRTETAGSETTHSSLDRAIIKWLCGVADPALLAEIENAPLERDYFSDLVLAMQRTFVYDDAALCFLPRATGAEIVGEVADLLVRARGISKVLCAAIIEDDLLLSSRTQRGFGNASELLQATIDGLGGCGGHTYRAGGKIPNVGPANKAIEEMHDLLRSRWLKACGVDRQRGTRLVPLREIVDNL